MKFIITHFTIVLLFAQLGFSQVENSRATSVNTNKALVDITLKIQSLDNASNQTVIGTPFLNEDWVEGEVTVSSGRTFTGLQLKYDSFNEQLIYLNEVGDSLNFNMNLIKEFVLNDKEEFHFVKRSLAEHPNTSFYQLLYSGSTQLIKFFKKDILAFDSESSSMVDTNPRFITKQTYYLIEGDQVCELKRSRNKFAACFNSKDDFVKKLIKSEGIDFKEEQGMKKIVQACESEIK